MIIPTLILVAVLMGAVSANSTSTTSLRTKDHPLELRCEVVLRIDAKVFTKTKITLRLAKGDIITQEFCRNNNVEGFVACEINGKTFNLIEFFANEDKITCSCHDRFCLPYNAVIEQKLENKTWTPTSSWTTKSTDLFQISALKTSRAKCSYRCVIHFDDKFAETSQYAINMDDAMVVFCCCLLIFVVISQIFVLLMLTTSARSSLGSFWSQEFSSDCEFSSNL